MNRELTPGEIAAVCYGDIFNFPLTSIEMKKFAINSSFKKISFSTIQEKDGLYFLKGRSKLVALRKKRKSYSADKLERAKKVVSFIRHIPTIQMVAVTGALAMENCDKDDDIDLLIVSKRDAVWTTRFFSIVILEILGKRRRPQGKNSSNKICLNMFLDEDHLAVPKKEQDIFAAHEVAQVQILWGREEVVDNFWKLNGWVKNYLPNVNYKNSAAKKVTNMKTYWNVFEPIFRSIQLMYMDSRRTSEIISDGYLRFHPNDARKWVIPGYEKRLALLGLK